MTILPETIVRRAESVLFSRLDDEVLAIDGERGYLYALNDTGGRIWELLEAPIAVSELCDRLIREYQVDPTACRADVTEIIGRLNAAGLVEVT